MGKQSNFNELLKVKGVSTKNNSKDDSLEKPLPYSDVQSGEVIPSYVKLCSNKVYGFEVSYPNDWFTTYNTDSQECTYFAPFSFVVPQVTDADFVPIKIEIEKSVDWDQTLKLYENPNELRDVLSVNDLQINNRSVEKVKSVSTAAAGQTKGLLKITYLVFDSNTPLALSYTQLDEKEDPSSGEKTLEDIVRSLKFY